MVNYSIPDVYLPLYSMGVTGLNEIVGISDTGIDYDSCYFLDPAHPTPAFDSVSMSSRKIVQYLYVNAENRETDNKIGYVLLEMNLSFFFSFFSF